MDSDENLDGGDDESSRLPSREDIRQEQDRLKNLKTLSEEELAAIRREFVQFYPTPLSNGQGQGRFQLQNGLKSMSESQAQAIWETTLENWSKKWWSFYEKFNEECRARKRRKTKKDPTLNLKEVHKWAAAFRTREGPARSNQ